MLHIIYLHKDKFFNNVETNFRNKIQFSGASLELDDFYWTWRWRRSLLLLHVQSLDDAMVGRQPLPPVRTQKVCVKRVLFFCIMCIYVCVYVVYVVCMCANMIAPVPHVCGNKINGGYVVVASFDIICTWIIGIQCTLSILVRMLYVWCVDVPSLFVWVFSWIWYG